MMLHPSIRSNVQTRRETENEGLVRPLILIFLNLIYTPSTKTMFVFVNQLPDNILTKKYGNQIWFYSNIS